MSVKALLLGSAILANFTVCAYDSRDLSTLSLAELLNVKVKLASKNEETQINSSSSVSLFTHEDIRRLGIKTLPDLLSHVPGFYSMMNSAEGNQSHIVMRGHAQKYANTLLVLLNGHRLNDDYTGGINYLMRFINLNNVEKVEVIRGPGSALYGSNAYSGVINIITKFEPEVSISLGNLGSKSVFVSQNLVMGEWELGVSADLYRDEGYQYKDIFDRNGLQNDTQDPREVEQASLRFGNEGNQFNLHYLHSSRDDYYLFRRLRDGVSKIDLTHWSFYSNHRLVKENDWTLDLDTGYQTATRKSLTALQAGGTPPYEAADFLFGEDFEYQSVNLALDASYKWSESHQFNLGLSHYHTQVPDAYLRSNYNIFGDMEYMGQVVSFIGEDFRVVQDKKRNITSAYLQNQWQPTDALKLTSGIRFDSYNDVENALTPRFSLVYQKSENETLKLIYGEAYRAPSLGDLYDNESGLTVGNQSLKASELRSLELVYSYSAENFSAITTYFDNHHKNLIGFRVGEDDNVFLDNVAQNEAHGIELEWRYHLTEDLKLSSAWTHLFSNKSDLGIAISLPASEQIVPKSYANFSIDYSAERWNLDISGTWRDKVTALQSQGHLLLINSVFQYQLNEKMSIDFNVTNLFDKKYATSSYVVLGTEVDSNNNVMNIQEYPARGRHWMLQFTFRAH